MLFEDREGLLPRFWGWQRRDEISGIRGSMAVLDLVDVTDRLFGFSARFEVLSNGDASRRLPAALPADVTCQRSVQGFHAKDHRCLGLDMRTGNAPASTTRSTLSDTNLSISRRAPE